MDVETSSKKKQMFILKISWRLVCGPKSQMKGFDLNAAAGAGGWLHIGSLFNEKMQ